LLYNGVLMLCHDFNECFPIQIIENGNNVNSAYEFVNMTVFYKIVLDNLMKYFIFVILLFFYIRTEAHYFRAYALFYDLLNTVKRAAAYKQNISGINLNKFLLRMLPAASGRNVGYRTLKNFKQSLLYAFAANVPRY